MKQGLSKREKVLLFIAGVMLLSLAAFRFAIMPIYDQYTAKQEEYDTLSSEKALLDLRLQHEDVTRTLHEKSEQAVADIKDRYPALMPNEEADRILTGICLKNKLSPVMLSMSGPVRLVDSQKASTESQDGKNTAAFVVVQATMNLSGDYDSLKALIRAVNEIHYIRISRLSFSFSQDTNNTGSPNISVVFEITMLDDTQ